MSPGSSNPRAAGNAVLHIGARAVEWFERDAGGSLRHARIELTSPDEAELVRAAEEAWRASGSSTRDCVLALGRPFALHKLLALPAIARRDLGEVFRRKAQTMVGLDRGPPYFTALEMRRAGGQRAQEAQGWLLCALPHGTRALRVRLRERGFRVRRVVSAELAALEWSRQRALDARLAALLIIASEAAVSVSLVEGERLVYQESIEGDLAARPALVTGLVHEIKTCAAFWRKESRGQTVSQVVVGGLPRARVELLAVTLSSILPGASVRASADEAADPDGRLGGLAAAAVSGALNPDLTCWLPQRRRSLGLIGALAAAAVLALATLGFEAGVEAVQARRAEARTLRRASADLEELATRTNAAESLLAEAHSHLRRGAQIAGHGVPLERTLATVLAAFQGQARLEHLSLRVDEDQRTRLTLRGRCADDPARLVSELRAILARLRLDPSFDELRLLLPQELGQQDEFASFSIESVLRGA